VISHIYFIKTATNNVYRKTEVYIFPFVSVLRVDGYGCVIQTEHLQLIWPMSYYSSVFV
jgi:hypothetical protein